MRIALLVTALVSLTLFAANEDVDKLRQGGQASVDKLIADGAKADLLDRVCAQKDCHVSRLFWYTSLDEAKAAARETGRPILALYMLGRLDEELSCANSRFFRVMLYSDPAIASVLRERYVLYWHSVRPVPRVTIDMGDGRKIQQTITGNSIHYLLDADGRVLDGLPGLHSPQAFREQLEGWLALDRTNIKEYHLARATGPVERIEGSRPRAEDASRLAMTKAIDERPLLRELKLGVPLPPPLLAEAMEMEFSAQSLALMRTKQVLTDELMNNLRATITTDMFLNAEMHGAMHQWFADGEVTDLESLNERVYAELFLTPSDDPWLGLNPSAAFAAIAN